ncbi:unnamed protein product [Boreogadus saida]
MSVTSANILYLAAAYRSWTEPKHKEPCWPADEPSPVKVLGLPLTPEIHLCSATALKTVMCDDRPGVTVGSGLQDRPLVHLSPSRIQPGPGGCVSTICQQVRRMAVWTTGGGDKDTT